METIKKYAVIVIGAGAGGLVVAIGAAKAGKKVLLIEKGDWGGDCTNFGCIPSKTLIACAEKAQAIDSSAAFGIHLSEKNLIADQALEKVRKTIEKIRRHEEPPSLEKIGVETFTGKASFLDPHHLHLKNDKEKEQTVYGKKIVIAAGSHPYIPPIEGLRETPYLTNETIFSLKKIPRKLGIIGAGPIGCELAQAFSRLGSEVTLIASKKGIMPREDTDVTEVIADVFKQENIDLKIGCEMQRISYADGKFSLCVQENEEEISIEVDQLLISTGRRTNVAGLDLEKAKIQHTDRGIIIDSYGRTNHSHIFAIGDITGPPFFTHRAENHARTVLTSILLPGPLKKKLDPQAIPRCTFTDPEVASLGLLEREALEKFGEKSLAIYKVSMEDVDRAICCQREQGFVKIITKKWSSKILGATIVAPRAGEMLQELSLAMLQNIPLRKLARLIHPYPIYSAAIRKCADLWLTQTILGALRRKK